MTRKSCYNPSKAFIYIEFLAYDEMMVKRGESSFLIHQIAYCNSRSETMSNRVGCLIKSGIFNAFNISIFSRENSCIMADLNST